MTQFALATSADYRITAQGWLDESWSDRLAGMHIKVIIPEDKIPVIILLGHLQDQAELLGVLNSLYELRLPIISVETISDAVQDNQPD
jgi:hypothetical protein